MQKKISIGLFMIALISIALNVWLYFNDHKQHSSIASLSNTLPYCDQKDKKDETKHPRLYLTCFALEQYYEYSQKQAYKDQQDKEQSIAYIKGWFFHLTQWLSDEKIKHFHNDYTNKALVKAWLAGYAQAESLINQKESILINELLNGKIAKPLNKIYKVISTIENINPDLNDSTHSHAGDAMDWRSYQKDNGLNHDLDKMQYILGDLMGKLLVLSTPQQLDKIIDEHSNLESLSQTYYQQYLTQDTPYFFAKGFKNGILVKLKQLSSLLLVQ